MSRAKSRALRALAGAPHVVRTLRAAPRQRCGSALQCFLPCRVRQLGSMTGPGQAKQASASWAACGFRLVGQIQFKIPFLFCFGLK
jgi:hypothetical protein